MLGFQVAGRLSGLAREEVLAIARRLGCPCRIISDRFVVCRCSDFPLDRLSYTQVAGRRWFSFHQPREFGKLATLSGLRAYVVHNAPFAVRSPFGPQFNRILGWYLDGSVDLRNPKTLVYVLPAAGRYHVLAPALPFSPERFKSRDVKNRPFHHPTSMNAREARLLVNVSGVLPGETLLDPFAGAGGILIEAAAVGAHPIGVDAVDEMIAGAQENLEHFGLSAELIHGDARSLPLPDDSVDAIVTDLPYGRSSKVVGQLRSLYSQSFREMFRVLRRGRRAVVVCNRDVSGLLSAAGFLVIRSFRWYVHSGLTRRVFVCQK